MVSLATGRVILDDGDTERGSATLLVQRPVQPRRARRPREEGGQEHLPRRQAPRAAGAGPGSKREQFRQKEDDAIRSGEVTTIETRWHGLLPGPHASLEAYGKLKTEYAPSSRAWR